jgi:Phage integrase family
MISDAIQKAVRDARVKKYRFHDYRNTALTDWARRGVNVDIAMKASRHTSVQMHKRYLDLQREDVAKAFGLLQDGNTEKDEEQVESQVADFTEGEGRCPVVPLVFKTSLGVVRSPEGSTPSLLRHNLPYRGRKRNRRVSTIPVAADSICTLRPWRRSASCSATALMLSSPLSILRVPRAARDTHVFRQA